MKQPKYLILYARRGVIKKHVVGWADNRVEAERLFKDIEYGRQGGKVYLLQLEPLKKRLKS